MNADERILIDSANDLRNRLAWAAHTSGALVSPRRRDDGSVDPLVLVHVPVSSTAEVRRVLASAEIESENRYLLTGRLGAVAFRLWRTPTVHEVARVFSAVLLESAVPDTATTSAAALSARVCDLVLAGEFGDPVEPTSSSVETIAAMLVESPQMPSVRLVGDSATAHVRTVTGALSTALAADGEVARLALAMRAPRPVAIHRQPVPVPVDRVVTVAG